MKEYMVALINYSKKKVVEFTKPTINIPASLLAHQYYPSILPGLGSSYWLSEYDDGIFPVNP